MSATDTRAKDCRHLIGGQWVDSAEGGRFDDLDPYTGDVVATVAAGGREGRAAGDPGSARGLRGLVSGRPRAAPGRVPEGRRRPRIAPRRGRRLARQGDRMWVDSADGRHVRRPRSVHGRRGRDASPRAVARTPGGRSRPRTRRSARGRRPGPASARPSSSRRPTCSSRAATRWSSWLAKETGCSFGFGMFQMGFVPGLFRQAAGAAYAPHRPGDPLRPARRVRDGRAPARSAWSAAISPWNAALILSARAIAAPLVFGNTVVLKPSEESPYVGGLLWGEIFAEAGLPDGVLNIVTHDRAGAPGDRRRAGREPARAPDQLHRLDRHRPQAGRGRRPQPQAGRARAGRPEPADRAGRRRPRLRGQRGRLRRLPAPGPDLHVGAADHRRAPDRRGVHRRAGRQGRGPRRRRPARAHHDHRPADQRRPRSRRSAGASTRSSRPGRRCSPAAAPRAAATGPRCSPTCPATASSPRSRRSARWRRSRWSTAPTRRSTRANATSYGLASGIITTDPDKGLAIAEPARGGHRPRQRPAGARRAADAVRRRQGQRLGPVRRHVRDGRVHRDAVGDRAERDAAVPVLSGPIEGVRWRRSSAWRRPWPSSSRTATRWRSRGSPT